MSQDAILRQDNLALFSENDLDRLGYWSRFTRHRKRKIGEFPEPDFQKPNLWTRETLEKYERRVKATSKRIHNDRASGQTSCVTDPEPF